MSKKLSTTQDLTIGCDPEFFLTKNGRVVGSENLIPKGGLTTGYGKFIRDGVQIELNPNADTCRGRAGNYIGRSFQVLRDALAKDKTLGLHFGPTVKLRKTEFNNLSDDSKQFGCAISYNVNDKGEKTESSIDVDPMTHRGRSAGGHLHLGMNGARPVERTFAEVNDLYYRQYGYFNNETERKQVAEREAKYTVAADARRIKMWDALHDPTIIVPVLDVLVGNTCVLLDRYTGNITRRKTYGRAGEYRTPTYGVEYRVLSNFWLRCPEMYSLVTGLARLAVQACAESTDEKDYRKELMELVNMKDIHKAINKNDADLAMRNFRRIEQWLKDNVPDGGFFPITNSTLPNFYRFVEQGLESYLVNDPLTAWAGMADAHSHGAYNFLLLRVTNNPPKAAKV